ncbi:penicillin-binding transpeptidase domain-containing protein [Nesterenkonia sp. NBAIMH1]|uniref:penicillin-binding transpeptidase domain-containing protein n=1 Tax=Nesterenkonia sp. NBAIMH1 TaxID=2600320 RepID=UPI0011B4F280|nr:penicillin-binding transpeptidase domain-containing protein [Nesterenkonia sp. NBAIMH1]
MNRAIRHTWMVSIAMFMTLLVALSLIQVVLTEDLNSHPNNARQTIQQAGAPRGPITVEGTPIVESVESENSVYDYQRVYNEPELYAGITGFYSTSEGAPAGIEQAENDFLTGQSDSQFIDRVTTLFTGDTMHGAQVELTLDHSMQQAAYNLIPNDARGSIVVTEIETGDVKAMASKPSYDPNELAVHSNSQYTENRSRIIDQAGVDPYSFRPLNSPIFPGSSFKLVTAAAMLESGDYAPDDELDNPPEIDLPDSSNTLPNFRDGGCGAQSQAELNWIFANSCNTPFAEAAMDIGQGSMLETAEAFGFNQPLRIPNHVTASNFPQDDIEDAFLALSSIGQDNVTATPLQMNMAAAAVANDGAMMRPQLVDTIRGSDLQILSQPASEVLNDAMSSSTAADIADMMVETAETGTGAAASAQTSHDIAVKTGTAETGEDGEVHSWITGFAPADEPQYAITVAYERTSYSAGSSLTAGNFAAMVEEVMSQ